ncbi:hypothetical protein ABZ479_20460 [Streptomyces sp. NPDC005722]
MFPARVRAGASSALAVLALSGCSAGWGCSGTTAERGAAGVRVRVEDDEERVVLGCRTISPSQAFGPNGDPTGDDWLTVGHPGRVAAVLVIPDDRSYDRRTCEQDIKDGGGPHPPEPARIGERLQAVAQLASRPGGAAWAAPNSVTASRTMVSRRAWCAPRQ